MSQRNRYLWAAVALCLLLAGCAPGGGTSSSPAPVSSASSSGISSADTSLSAASSSQEDTSPPPTLPEPVPDESLPDPAPVAPPQLVKPENRTLYILMYHHIVQPGEYYNNWTITTDRLREDLQWLQDNGYATLLPSQLAAGEPLPDKAVLVTFDDGYESNYTLGLPILQQFQVRAAIALIVERIDSASPGFLTWDMCRDMQASGLVEFGSHTYDSHKEDPRGIKRQSGETQDEYRQRALADVQRSIDRMAQELGSAPIYFAYPHGQTEPWADEFLAQNFSVTVTTRHGPAKLENDLYDLPRHNITVENPVSKYLP